MIHLLRAHPHAVDFVGTFAQIFIADASRQLVQLHGKIVVLHLTRQHIAQRQMRAFRTVDLEAIIGLKERRKKWKALNMVPMGVRQENGGRNGSGSRLQQVIAQRSSAGAAIQHQNTA